MPRHAGSVYVQVQWDLTSEDEPTPTMQDAGVTRIVAIPASEFNERYEEAPEEWVPDWLSDQHGWLVESWCFA